MTKIQEQEPEQRHYHDDRDVEEYGDEKEYVETYFYEEEDIGEDFDEDDDEEYNNEEEQEEYESI